VYLEYRAVQFRNKDLGLRGYDVPKWTGLVLDDDAADEKYAKLHDKHALPIRDLVLKMRGFYFKNAQLLSTRDDFVPSAYLQWCKQTQDAAPCEMAVGEAKEIVTEALRNKLGDEFTKFEDVFVSWDETPIGVASIGTVHAATLSTKYGGADVVIKVQAPGIERRFRADIKTCIDFCKLAMPQHAPPLREIEKQFLTEFDYQVRVSH
jgi:aarF domain-containing kinase